MKDNCNAGSIKRDLIEKYPVLSKCSQEIDDTYGVLLSCFNSGHQLLVAGNGGSAADSEHISGELMKSFRFRREIDASTKAALQEQFGNRGELLGRQLEGALPTIPLTSFSAILTAYTNDVAPNASFAQLLYGYGNPGDVFLGITTSGNSENVYQAFMVAKAKKLTSICLTGRDGGRCAQVCDLAIHVPEDDTYLIQELHLPVYHALCAMLEAEIFERKQEN